MGVSLKGWIYKSGLILKALQNEEYTTTTEYADVFSDGRSQYVMNDKAAYEAEMEAVYTEFAEWLAEWEL